MLKILRKVVIGFEILLISSTGITALADVLNLSDYYFSFFITYGIATIVFHSFFYITGKKRVPLFLGPSLIIATAINSVKFSQQRMAFITGGILIMAAVLLLTGLVIRKIGLYRIIKLFPPVIVGSMVISIGIGLAISQRNNLMNMPSDVMLITLLSLILIYAFIPAVRKYSLILGATIGYGYFLLTGATSSVPNSSVSYYHFVWPQFNFEYATVFVIAAFAVVVEHIGDIYAISMVSDTPFYINPGLNNTLISHGVAATTCFFMPFSGPTTYSQSVGAYALLRDYDPDYALYAGFWSIAVGLLQIAFNIRIMFPIPIISALMFIAFGMIGAIGVRIFVENQINIGNERNFIIVSIMLSISIFTVTIPGLNLKIGGIVISALTGIILNLILPGREVGGYENGLVD